MEKEQIIKVITQHNENCCNLTEITIAHIKELTEENDRLSTALAEYEYKTNIRISEEYYTAEAYDELREENERLKQLNESYAEIEQGCIVTGVKKVQADTVREMQTRFAMHFGTYRPTDVVKVTEVFKLLKKISGEMLYEEEECPSCKHFVGCECFDGETCDLYEKNTEDEEK